MPETAAPSLSATVRGFIFQNFAKSRDIMIAAFIIGILGIIFVPLDPWMMDLLLGGNIMVSLILLLTTMYVEKPIRFSTFPSLLLMTTLLRLSLNIATTRLILGNGAENGTAAAGGLVQSFGSFVGGQNLVIGLTIFAIIMIIQFVVITKGSTRIAEVAARFTLDAMPGKQMAIDAQLNAGAISEVEAQQQREEVQQLADFYGAMDGASKFVRGDAIAGIIITLINIVMGLIVGTVVTPIEGGVYEAAKIFTTLTIGDGLASQIPALMVSVGAGLLVTRGADKRTFAEEIGSQLFGERKAILAASVLMTALGFTGLIGVTPFPGMALLLVGGTCGAIWYLMAQAELVTEAQAVAAAEEEAAAQHAAAAAPERAEAFLHVDPLSLELGYLLVPLVDTSQGKGGLLRRIQGLREQMAQEIGIVVPKVRIRDNIQLQPNEYVVNLQGSPVARGTAEPDKYMAMDPMGQATEALDGIETTEPAYGLPAVWIGEQNREYAERSGYTVVDAETVVATHLTEVIKGMAHELLNREEVRHLLDTLREESPNLVQEVVPDVLTMAQVQRVLQNLLRERISIRNLPRILEVLGEYGSLTKDTDLLTEYVRDGLKRWICNNYAVDGSLYVVAFDPRLEESVAQAVHQTERGSFLGLRPQAQKAIADGIRTQVSKQVQAGYLPLLLVSPQIRMHMRRLCEEHIQELPNLAVMAHNEVVHGEYRLESIGMVTAEI